MLPKVTVPSSDFGTTLISACSNQAPGLRCLPMLTKELFLRVVLNLTPSPVHKRPASLLRSRTVIEHG
jgi:hypothetical protein